MYREKTGLSNLEILESIVDDVTEVSANYPDYDSSLLINILEDDIPWLTTYVSRVENFILLVDDSRNLKKERDYMAGYFDALKDLKRLIYEVG